MVDAGKVRPVKVCEVFGVVKGVVVHEHFDLTFESYREPGLLLGCVAGSDECVEDGLERVGGHVRDTGHAGFVHGEHETNYTLILFEFVLIEKVIRSLRAGAVCASTGLVAVVDGFYEPCECDGNSLLDEVGDVVSCFRNCPGVQEKVDRHDSTPELVFENVERKRVGLHLDRVHGNTGDWY